MLAAQINLIQEEDMVKKMTLTTFLFVFACSGVAYGESNNELRLQIDELNKKLTDVQSRLDEQEDSMEALEEGSEKMNIMSRIKFFGDIRARVDSNTTTVPSYYNAREAALAMRNFGMVTENSTPDDINRAFNMFKMGYPSVEARQAAMGMGGGSIIDAHDVDNDTLYTTRFRLNMVAQATENIQVKTRFVGYKVWGLQSSPYAEEDNGVYSPYFLTSRSFDGTAGRQPEDSKLLMDRAYLNWSNIGGMPVWFSIGRRPTTDGPPAQLRMGTDSKMATPINYMDYPFDGISLGYAYQDPMGLDGSGRIRFCYGRGFESGPNVDGMAMDDVDFAGISWDVFEKGDRFINFQSFGAYNIFNVPGDTVYPNPIEYAAANDNNPNDYTPDTSYYGSDDIYLDRVNLGDIYHTSILYKDKVSDLNYFLTGGWSHTVAEGIDELGASLLGSWGAEPEDKDGYGLYAGVRYDMDDMGLKLGAEFNWGSENWLAFTPGHDDMTASKLYTRGKVYEAYMIYDVPGGEKISEYSKAFIRLGYQYYDYDYTYSGMWLGTPTDIDELSDPLNAQFYAPIEEMQQIYMTFEVYF